MHVRPKPEQPDRFRWPWNGETSKRFRRPWNWLCSAQTYGSQYLHALNWLPWDILVCTLVVGTDSWRLHNDASKKSVLDRLQLLLYPQQTSHIWHHIFTKSRQWIRVLVVFVGLVRLNLLGYSGWRGIWRGPKNYRQPTHYANKVFCCAKSQVINTVTMWFLDVLGL